jgi:hypothetical protein
MLELGKAGAHAYAKGQLPVVRDGVVVAVLRASSRKDAVVGAGATAAVIGGTS